jgi:hypothetical protein
MEFTTDYRIARLHFLNDLIQSIADEEPALVDLTDWHSNYDAIVQMQKLIETGEV